METGAFLTPGALSSESVSLSPISLRRKGPYGLPTPLGLTNVHRQNP